MIDLAIAITGEVGGFQQTDRDARREQFPVPRPVIFVRDQTGILALQNPAHAFLHSLISLPVAARRHGVPLLPVAFIRSRDSMCRCGHAQSARGVTR